MIRLVAKVGLIIDFSMKTAAAESDLVRRFNLQEVKPDTVLTLGKYGKIKVEDIYAMSTRALTTVNKMEDYSQQPFDNIFGGAFK